MDLGGICGTRVGWGYGEWGEDGESGVEGGVGGGIGAMEEEEPEKIVDERESEIEWCFLS